MIACDCANGSVYLMEVSENMTFSAKNDKAILNAMLDRESKREKILEGKLREIKIRLKKQQEQQEARASDLLLRQAEKVAEDIKVPDELPKVKPSLSQALIEAADNEFNQMIEEELQRRIKEQEAYETDKTRKSPRVHKKKDDASDIPLEKEDDGEAPIESGIQNGHTNGTSNGHHENGHNENEADAAEHET